MSGTVTAGRILGTELRIHASFALLPCWFGILGWYAGYRLPQWLEVFSLLVLVCFCILVHEWGHVVCARYVGIKTKHVLLLPIGAFSKLEAKSQDLKTEVAIAASGPLVSLVLAGCLFGVCMAIDDPIWFRPKEIAASSFTQKLAWANLAIGAFNMIPALPMDGGKVAFGVLTKAVGLTSSTVAITVISYTTAALFFLAGFYFDLFFFVFSAVIFWGARRDIHGRQAEGLVRELTASEAMSEDYVFLTEEMEVLPRLDDIFTSAQKEFPVVRDGLLVGSLTRSDLARGISGGRKNLTVREIMAGGTDVSVLSAQGAESLSTALARMQAHGLELLPVVDGARLLGVLKREDAKEADLTQQAQNEAVFHSESKLF